MKQSPLGASDTAVSATGLNCDISLNGTHVGGTPWTVGPFDTSAQSLKYNAGLHPFWNLVQFQAYIPKANLLATVNDWLPAQIEVPKKDQFLDRAGGMNFYADSGCFLALKGCVNRIDVADFCTLYVDATPRGHISIRKNGSHCMSGDYALKIATYLEARFWGGGPGERGFNTATQVATVDVAMSNWQSCIPYVWLPWPLDSIDPEGSVSGAISDNCRKALDALSGKRYNTRVFAGTLGAMFAGDPLAKFFEYLDIYKFRFLRESNRIGIQSDIEFSY